MDDNLTKALERIEQDKLLTDQLDYLDDLVHQQADYISRLEAVVRAGDSLHDELNRHVGSEYTEAIMDAWEAERSRVTLPPLTQTNQAKDGDKEDASNAT